MQCIKGLLSLGYQMKVAILKYILPNQFTISQDYISVLKIKKKMKLICNGCI